MKKILSLSIIASFCLTAMADDFSLYYDANEGQTNNRMESVANMQKITFENGNIVITRKDGTTASTPIASVKRIFFSTDEAVGIEAPAKVIAENEDVYDLTGRKIKNVSINNLPKGIYIVDGKKIQITK